MQTGISEKERQASSPLNTNPAKDKADLFPVLMCCPAGCVYFAKAPVWVFVVTLQAKQHPSLEKVEHQEHVRCVRIEKAGPGLVSVSDVLVQAML